MLISPPAVGSAASSDDEESSESDESDEHAISSTAISATNPSVKNRLNDISLISPFLYVAPRM